MQMPSTISPSTAVVESELRIRYVGLIAVVAALGGLLFGYDWVVIGGAKPFYEAYFMLDSPSQIGWANSCALVGCFVGSLIAGKLSDRFGRKKILLLSAFLFAVSSALTGWSYSFSAFIAWRILGGTAIGFASNVSPTYIAEISPASWRGRLVSLNQLALVVGILGAQIVNWRISERVPDHVTQAFLRASWNAQYGWRWMFTAVAVPAIVLLFATPFIPESPRWLVAHGDVASADSILTKIGGKAYSHHELGGVLKSLSIDDDEHGGKREQQALKERSMQKLLAIGVALAVLQQASGINVLFNYAEEVYKSAGYGVSGILFNIVITGTINLIFTVLAMLFVDRFGRRPLMLLGCLGIGVSHLAASWAYRQGLHGTWILVLTLCAIACYAVSLAPVTWVLITEIFPNRVRATGVSLTVASLWVASFVLTYTFPILSQHLGTSGTFLIYGCICFVGAFFVFVAVPETKGRALETMGIEAG